MSDAHNKLLIILPMLFVVAVTLAGFVKMAVGRAAAVKGGQDPAFYRVYLGDPEPEATRAAVRHWDNLFELPTLLYAGCLTAFALDAVTTAILAFAWLFAIGRAVQSAVHLTYNNPSHRGAAFTVAVLSAFAMWAAIGVVVFSRL